MKQKDIIFIITSALIVVVVWIAFEIIHSSTTSTISEQLNSQVIPIKASFDEKVIQDIKNRNEINPLYESSSRSATPTLTPTQTPSSPSAQPLLEETETAEEASPEGELSQ